MWQNSNSKVASNYTLLNFMSPKVSAKQFHPKLLCSLCIRLSRQNNSHGKLSPEVSPLSPCRLEQYSLTHLPGGLLEEPSCILKANTFQRSSNLPLCKAVSLGKGLTKQAQADSVWISPIGAAVKSKQNDSSAIFPALWGKDKLQPFISDLIVSYHCYTPDVRFCLFWFTLAPAFSNTQDSSSSSLLSSPPQAQSSIPASPKASWLAPVVPYYTSSYPISTLLTNTCSEFSPCHGTIFNP